MFWMYNSKKKNITEIKKQFLLEAGYVNISLNIVFIFLLFEQDKKELV